MPDEKVKTGAAGEEMCIRDSLHVGSELAVLDLLEALLIHLGKEQLIGIHGQRGLCRLDEAGAEPLFGVAVKGRCV